MILFAFSDNLSAENSKLSADSWNRGNHLFGCMMDVVVVDKVVEEVNKKLFKEYNVFFFILQS